MIVKPAKLFFTQALFNTFGAAIPPADLQYDLTRYVAPGAPAAAFPDLVATDEGNGQFSLPLADKLPDIAQDYQVSIKARQISTNINSAESNVFIVTVVDDSQFPPEPPEVVSAS